MKLLTTLLACLLWTAAAQAGGGCSDRKITAEEVRNAVNMAVRTRDYLERSGADVAIVARVGSDLSKHGLRYSHIGAVLRDHPEGPWVFVHLLNECGADKSSIYDEGMVNFFLDDLFAYEALVAIPTPELQARLREILRGPDALAMHTSRYSMLAKPDSAKYQNSNQWVLDTAAMALAPNGKANSRQQAQSWLRSEGFEGDYIKVSALERAGAGLFRANVSFDDHTSEEASKGAYEAVTVRAVMRFLDRRRALVSKRVIPLEGNDREPLVY